jgi:hypothetical protein
MEQGRSGMMEGAGKLLNTIANGKDISTFIWICDIAFFVFGDLPEYIYVQRIDK